MEAITVRQRLELRLSKLLPLLTPRMQIRLSGRPPVTVDGLTLEPELQLMLAMLERGARPPYEELPLAEARAEMRRGALIGGGTPPALPHVRELTVPGPAGPLRARHYAPQTETLPPLHTRRPLPLIVFLHGGGFVLGDLDSHDAPCRLLARHAGAHVLSIDYRLAPEHRFPAAVEDAVAALRWGLDHASELGADPQRVAIGGDSAGGNLSAVAAHLVAREGGRQPALQILIYPATEFLELSHSQHLFDEGFLLTRRDMDWFSAQYVGEADATDPRLSITRAQDLRGLPPAIVVSAGFDPLRDEGEAYAARLREAGVPVVLRRFPGLIHGFINLVGISRSSRDATIELAGATRALLAGADGAAAGGTAVPSATALTAAA